MHIAPIIRCPEDQNKKRSYVRPKKIKFINKGDSMFNLPNKLVEVDGFKIPADKVDEYKRTRDSMEKATIKFFKTFCEVVKKEKLLDFIGEGIVGYSSTGEMLAKLSLNPFELAAMNVALQRKKLNEYILATNGYNEDDYRQLLKEFEERKQAARDKK